jgi:hypothetical protein
VIEAVCAADRAVKTDYQTQLNEAGRSALLNFSNNCKTIANLTKPRLLKKARTQLDEAVAVLEAHGWLHKIPGGTVVAGEQRRLVWRIVRDT